MENALKIYASQITFKRKFNSITFDYSQNFMFLFS